MFARMIRMWIVAILAAGATLVGSVGAQADPLAVTSPSFGEDVTPLLSGVGTPFDTLEVRLNGIALGTTSVLADSTWSFQVSSPLPINQGILFEVVSVAGAGVGEQTMASYSVLAPLPALSITSPVDGATVGRSFSVSGTLSAPSATYLDLTLSVDGVATPTFVGYTTTAGWMEWIANYVQLSAGSHELVVTGRDSVGRSVESDPVTVEVDLTPPASGAVVTPAPDSTVRSTQFTITGTGPPGTKISLIFDHSGMPVIEPVMVGPDGTWTAPVASWPQPPYEPFAWIHTLPVPVETVSLMLLTEDAVGNSASASVSWTIDLRPVVTPTPTPTPTETPSTTPTPSSTPSPASTPTSTTTPAPGLASTGADLDAVTIAGCGLLALGAALLGAAAARRRRG